MLGNVRGYFAKNHSKSKVLKAFIKFHF
uniref:Uncharacterized protein n=1 Tax=Anguilla anguilla TaxID=7936 RepID=A0A0E9PUP0_ANGAN